MRFKINNKKYNPIKTIFCGESFVIPPKNHTVILEANEIPEHFLILQKNNKINIEIISK